MLTSTCNGTKHLHLIIAGIKTPKTSPQDVAQIPSTVGAYILLDVLEISRGSRQINRFPNICAQEQFKRFSPEELRWKHEVDGESQEDASNPNLPFAPLVPPIPFYFQGVNEA